jgi:hypothetical protein
VVLTTGQSRFQARNLNQGWWSSGIANDLFNDNYIVGRCCGVPGTYRDFFTFDLSAVDQHVVFASLVVFTGTMRVKGGSTEQLRLFDVSTPADVLNHNRGRNPAIFRDLGTGTSYGDYSLGRDQARSRIKLTLNRDAIRDLNAARGGFFSIGGRLTSLDGRLGPGADEFIFGASQGRESRLVLRTVPSPQPD